MLPELRRDTVRLGSLLSIAEQIQALGLARKTGEIYIINVPPPARINLIEGAIVDAQFGLRSGMDAAVALINLPDSQSEFIVGEKAPRRTIDKPFIEVLCEAARVKDESGSTAPLGITEPLPAAPSSPYLRITLGTEVKTFSLHLGLMHVGRATSNEIIINDPTISQRHASIEYSDTGILLKDLGSTNGTYIAGEPIKERWLSAQVNLQFGSVYAVFNSALRKPAA